MNIIFILFYTKFLFFGMKKRKIEFHYFKMKINLFNLDWIEISHTKKISFFDLLYKSIKN